MDGPRREEAVGTRDIEMLILRLTAVIFVFALLRFRREGKDTGRETVLYLIVVAASATVNLLRNGGGGLFLALAGSAAALTLAFPFLAGRRAYSADIVAPAAAGALLGPLGGPAVLLLAAVIHIVRLSPGRQPVTADLFAVPGFPSVAPNEPRDPSLLEILENRRSVEERSPRGNSGGMERNDPSPDAAETAPWRTSLAVATLAALMTGIFI